MIPKEKTVNEIKNFIKTINMGAGMLRNDAMEEGLLFKIAYNQGAMDVTRDILSYMDDNLLEPDLPEEKKLDKDDNMYG